MASAVKDAEVAIAQRFNTQWASATQVAWEGVDFDPPSKAEWVRVTVLWGNGNHMTYGGSGVGKNEVVGIVDVDLFSKPGAGTATVKDHADTARDIFNRAEFSSLAFGVPSAPRRVGVINGWLQHKVSCPFELEETL